MMKGLWPQKELECLSPELVHPCSVSVPGDIRTNSVNRLNPVKYATTYFGHKFHMDQNEKLITFGVTHVMARDGYFRYDSGLHDSTCEE